MTWRRRKKEAEAAVAEAVAVVVVEAEAAEVAVVEAETTLIVLVDLVATEPTLMNPADNSTDEDQSQAALMTALGNTTSLVLKEELMNNAIILTLEAALAVKAELKFQTFIIQSWNRICNVW